ncbi:CYLD [Cordylochernes scorpioides]|uniref:ubiquitinyl hydrolase 1 n=1 Tax=Cordylochernes scorpioides TaxID=51811 RepID=A0ABY6K6V3_9ARAC|nr:CYLD [Cordylochernes scorpioides]
MLSNKCSAESTPAAELEVGSVVEVSINQSPCYGVIRWIGDPNGDSRKMLLAGVELEEEHPGCTDGTLNGKRYFTCPPHKAYFVRLNQCRKDSRFQETQQNSQKTQIVRTCGTGYDNHAASTVEPAEENGSALFGSIECPTVTGDIPPLTSLEPLYGKNKGIQGHHNSCYLDATLFSMFSCTSVFDSLLYRPPGPHDIPEYLQVQRVLKEEIVNPLRANCYVRADRVMKLRTLLDKLSSVSGLTSEEKDPEEFLNCLLNQIMKAEPFLKLSSGQESFFYQLFLEKDERLTLPTVQHLFDQSFLMSDIKLQQNVSAYVIKTGSTTQWQVDLAPKEMAASDIRNRHHVQLLQHGVQTHPVPACLLIQMPRFGRQFKMYPRIQPSQYLDITDVLENSPRQCSICGQLAEFECKECFGHFGEGLDSIAFCSKCMEKSHSHKKRARHHSTRLKVPQEFQMLKEHSPIPRIYMELFAVVCIETSHYVSFVKCGSGHDAPWCFFDSMADRKGKFSPFCFMRAFFELCRMNVCPGEVNGYNIPEVVQFPDLQWWLAEDGSTFLLGNKDDKALPSNVRRLICDAYMCMYQSPQVMMYR